jgi:hypothetical protein
MANIALEEDAGVDSEGKALGAFGAFKEGTTLILGNLCLVCLLNCYHCFLSLSEPTRL